VGRHKKKIWSIENEWRFRLYIFPIDNKPNTSNSLYDFHDYVTARIPPLINHYLLKIEGESFTKMKIRLGPKMEHGDQEIISAIVKAYNPSAIIEGSSLANDVR
jgi:hypothetical protein